MHAIIKIRKQSSGEIIDYQQLMSCFWEYRKPRDKIRRMLDRGELVRIRKGLYVFGEDYRREPVSRELLANLIYGPSYISLDYALSYYGLIPERVDVVTSVCLGRSRDFNTPFNRFTYRSLNDSRYAVGARLEKKRNFSFFIASPEKALIDKIWADKRIAWNSKSFYQKYLQEDLRIEIQRLCELDGEMLHTLGRAYDSHKIRMLIDFLFMVKERNDA